MNVCCLLIYVIGISADLGNGLFSYPIIADGEQSGWLIKRKHEHHIRTKVVTTS